MVGGWGFRDWESRVLVDSAWIHGEKIWPTPTALSAYRPAPMRGASPTLPGCLNFHPLVDVAAQMLPSLSRQRRPRARHRAKRESIFDQRGGITREGVAEAQP
jgi:hypothetical protein